MRNDLIDLAVSVLAFAVLISLTLVCVPLIYLLWLPASLIANLYTWSRQRSFWKPKWLLN